MFGAKIDRNPLSNNFTIDMRQRPLMDGNMCIQRSSNENCRMDRRVICDKRNVVASGFPPHIPFRNEFFVVNN